MWKLIFSESTNIGTGYNREPGVGEFSRDLAPAQCSWFYVYPERYKWNGTTIEEIPGAKEEHELRDGKKSLQNKANSTCESHILAKYSVYDQLNTLAGHYGEEAKGVYSLFTLNCRSESNRVWDLIGASTTLKEAEDAFATLNLPKE